MRRLLLSLILACLLGSPIPGWAAVAHQSSTAFTNTPADTSHTQSVTVSTGSDLVMVVAVGIEDETNTVSSITFNGSALTFHSRHACSPVSTLEWWYMVNPTVTTANVVVTVTGSEQFSGGVMVFTGAKQTSPLGTPTYNGSGGTCGTGANPSITLTDGTTGDMAIDLFMESAGSVTVGAGQTERWANSCLSSYCSHGSTEAGAASVTMSWTMGATDRHLSAVTLFQATGGGGGGAAPKSLMLMGVGQ